MPRYFDRYSEFRDNNEVKPIIGITIPESPNDKFTIYKQGLTRLDKLSNLYYNNPYSGWLIMLANPEYGGLEFNIPDSSSLRIPFPFEDAIERYNRQVTIHTNLYGQ